MLCFFQDAGLPIIYLDVTVTLAGTVVTQPQWLLRKLATIVCDKGLHCGEDEAAKMADKRLLSEYNALRNNGIASRKVLDALWDNDNVDYLIHVMKETLLACPWKEGDTDSMLVPSLLPPVPDGVRADVDQEFEGGALGWLAFDYLPRGFYQRVVCLIANHFESEIDTDCVYADLMILRFQDAPVLMETDNVSRIQFRFHREAKMISSVLHVFSAMADLVGEGFHQRHENRINLSVALSSDGSLDPTECAWYDKVISARTNGKKRVKSMSGVISIECGRFDKFFASSICPPAGYAAGGVEESSMIGKPSASYGNLDVVHEVSTVFLSHTGQNELYAWFAAFLSVELRRVKKIGTFFDACSLQSGDPWKAKIEKNAQGCKVFVCIVCSEYFDRYWCLHELDLALSSGRRVLPVFCDGEIPDVDDGLREKFANLLYRKFAKVDEDVVKRWCNNVRKLGDIQGLRFKLQGSTKVGPIELRDKVVDDIVRMLSTM